MSQQHGSTRSQVYWNTLLKIPTQSLTFAVSLVVARMLVPSDFGILGVAMMLINYANMFTDFGLSGAIIQKGIRDTRSLNSIFTFNLLVSVLLASLFYTTADYIATFFKSAECASVIRVMSSVFIITSFSAVPWAVLRRDMNFRTVAIAESGRSILMAAITLALAMNNYRYWALALGQLIPMLVYTVYLCVRVRWVPSITYHHPSMKSVLDFGVWNFLKTQLSYIINHIDKLTVGKFVGVTDLGYYDKGMSIALVPTDLLASMNAVLFSSFSLHKENAIELRSQLIRGLMTTSLICFPIYVGLLVVARHFVVGLLGPQWEPMIGPFRIVLSSWILGAMGGLLATINIAVGNYRAYTLTMLVCGSVFVGLCFGGVPYGVTGVAGAFFVYNILFAGLAVRLAIMAVGLSWGDVWRACKPAARATLCVLVLTRSLSVFLDRATVVNLCLLSAAGASVYILCLAVEREPAFVEFRRSFLADMKTVWPRRT